VMWSIHELCQHPHDCLPRLKVRRCDGDRRLGRVTFPGMDQFTDFNQTGRDFN
jgi:hypothetical protein